MNPEYAVISLVIRTIWSAIGVLLGTYALISVWRRWHMINKTAQAMWWFQIALTPISGLFVLWITLAFRGIVFQIVWQPVLVLIVGSLLALPNAFWLLVEASKKVTTVRQVQA